MPASWAANVKRLRLPLEQFNAPWGMMVNLQDVQHGMMAHRSVKSAWHIAKLFARLAADKVRYGRGTRLTMGNALAGRFLKVRDRRGRDALGEQPDRRPHS